MALLDVFAMTCYTVHTNEDVERIALTENAPADQSPAGAILCRWLVRPRGHNCRFLTTADVGVDHVSDQAGHNPYKQGYEDVY